MYTIQTGKFEKGTKEQQSAFINLFGCENIQYKFDFYFHWYNIVHEYGHCLCSHSNSDIIGLKQEFLVNDFAVNLWAYAGYEKELKALYKMLNEILERIKTLYRKRFLLLIITGKYGKAIRSWKCRYTVISSLKVYRWL